MDRLLWLRGASELLGASGAYLVPEGGAPVSVRQRSDASKVYVLDARDMEALLEQVGEKELPKRGAFLEPGSWARWRALTDGYSREFERLQKYRWSGYWSLPRNRSLTWLPGYLNPLAPVLEPGARADLALVIDLAWLYLLGILTAADAVTRSQLADPDRSLERVVAGGDLERRERERTALLLSRYLSENQLADRRLSEAFRVKPPYFPDLFDIVARVLRRRKAGAGALRVLEFVGVESVANGGAPWTEAFPSSDPVEPKLASDVVRFLAKASGLDSAFVAAFDNVVASRVGSPADHDEQPIPQAAQATLLFPSAEMRPDTERTDAE
jgi:hypothetical protein